MFMFHEFDSCPEPGYELAEELSPFLQNLVFTYVSKLDP